MNPIVQLAIQQAPEIITAFIEMFRKQHPDEPVPTSEEVMAAFEAAFRSSLAKDDAWLAAHPE